MFNLGFSELLILGVLALILIGPKELPEMARVVGRLLNELRRATSDFSSNFLNPNLHQPNHPPGGPYPAPAQDPPAPPDSTTMMTDTSGVGVHSDPSGSSSELGSAEIANSVHPQEGASADVNVNAMNSEGGKTS